MAKVHIGKKIKEIIDRSPMTVVEFAEKIHLTRDGANKIFKKTTISTDQLQKISRVLSHDFFSYYSTAQAAESRDPKNSYGFATRADIEQLTKMILNFALELERVKEELRAVRERKNGKGK
jgi:hypothetical protein